MISVKKHEKKYIHIPRPSWDDLGFATFFAVITALGIFACNKLYNLSGCLDNHTYIFLMGFIGFSSLLSGIVSIIIITIAFDGEESK